MSAFLQNLMIVSPGLLALGIVLFARLADRPSRKIEVAGWTSEQKAVFAAFLRSREGRAVLRQVLDTMPNSVRRVTGSV